MQDHNRFFDDLSKLVNGVVGTVAGASREAESAVRDRAKDWVGRDFVSREEFETVKEIAVKARLESETLAARLSAIEESISQNSASKTSAAKKNSIKSASARKSAAKTTKPTKTTKTTDKSENDAPQA